MAKFNRERKIDDKKGRVDCARPAECADER